MFARIRILSHFLTFAFIAALILQSAACNLIPTHFTAGLDSATRGVLEDGISELGNQPGKWDSTMTGVIDELGKVGTQTAKDVLNQVKNVYSSMLAQSVGMAGSAIKCQTDFFGIRAQQKLQSILHSYDSTSPAPTIIPIICGFDPNEVHASSDPANKTLLVHYYGFDFLDFDNKYSADLQYDNGQMIQKGFGSVAVASNYELTVEFQAADYSQVDFSKHPQLVLTWNQQQVVGLPTMKSVLPVINVDTSLVNNTIVNILPLNLDPGAPGPAYNIPPGLTIGIRHTDFLSSEFKGPADLGFLNIAPAIYNCCYDKGSSSGQGFNWWTMPDVPSADPSAWKLPPGVVLGLRHTDQGDMGPTVFGKDATQDGDFPGFTKMWGGDCCGNDPPFGFSWYVSTPTNFDWSKDQAWADHLPRGTVVGLKQLYRDPGYTFTWGSTVYDATDLNGPTPPGYTRICTVDNGAGDNSLCWFEKTWGVAVVLTIYNNAGVLGSGLEQNTDRPSLDYTYFGLTGDDPRICQAYCYGDSACVAWTFVHPGFSAPNARCYLKGAEPAPVSDKSCCVSGAISSP